MRGTLRAFSVALFALPIAWAQGLETTASRQDWEEVNFEFNSSVLSDGYPSLLRMSELLSKNPTFKVKLEGHTDVVGSERYNEKLGMARSATVKSFLLKYGARPEQVETVTYGKKQPKVDNRTKEGRFINRRVYMTVTDGQGRTIGAGGVADAIRGIEQQQSVAAGGGRSPSDCCTEILKRLDRLDDIVSMLKDLKGENAALKQEIENLKKEHGTLTAKVDGTPKPLTRDETNQVVGAAATDAIDKYDKAKFKPFSLMGVNLGSDADRHLTFTGAARLFAPFKNSFAVQAQGEYLYFHDRQEGQFDLGLVNRFKNFQAGAFTSFKNINLREFQHGGTLGQAAVTLDYLFKQGRIGLFGTKGFLDNKVVNLKALSRNIFDETYLKIVDQVGASTALGVYKNSYIEANLAYLKLRGGDDKPGGTIRFVQPLNDRWAFTLEGGFNETLIGRDHSGRVVAGLQFGNFIRPKEFVGLSHPVPVDVPRLRYELLTRRVRTGNDPPVADAGPDQTGVAAGAIALDGSASFDPDGDPITFQWAQIAGQGVALAGANTAKASFQAGEGQTYSFRLTVKDDKGAQALARVTVTTSAAATVKITRFVATPQVIRAGQTSVIAWQVLNADEVNVSGIGRVDAKGGTSSVAPTETTVYQITARNRTSESNETLTVTVERPEVRILSFQAVPVNITAGESSSLIWETENADEVLIDGIGNVDRSGSTSVSPAETTTYTLRARNRYGDQASTATVQVTRGTAPRVVRFSASPVEIQEGEQSVLTWQVENADSVSITSLSDVGMSGSNPVSPARTTTYVLTARNRFGETSASATVSVIPLASVAACLATPATLAKPGDPAVLSWVVQNAIENTVSGVSGTIPLGGPVTVNPLVETTYNVIVKGARSQTSCQITVKIAPQQPGGGGGGEQPGNKPPTVTISGSPVIETVVRQVQLFTTASDPEGDTITYSWRSLNTMAAILDPTSPNPRVQLGQLYGDYPFEVTATDSKGNSSKAIITVRLIVTRVQ